MCNMGSDITHVCMYYKLGQKTSYFHVYEGHFRSNINAIIVAYSMLFTSEVVYHRKRKLKGVYTEPISMMHNSRMRVHTCLCKYSVKKLEMPIFRL